MSEVELTLEKDKGIFLLKSPHRMYAFDPCSVRDYERWVSALQNILKVKEKEREKKESFEL